MRFLTIFVIEPFKNAIGEVLEGGEITRGAQGDFLELVCDLPVGRLARARVPGRRDREVIRLRHDGISRDSR